MHSIVALECRIVVAGRTLIVLCLHRVFEVVAGRCYTLKDMSDRYFT